jgi:uncharacterized protein YuzE
LGGYRIRPGGATIMVAGMDRIKYDPQADALYIYLAPSATVARTRNFSDTIILDFDAGGALTGIEVLNVRSGFDLAPVISKFGLDPGLNVILQHLQALLPSVKKELMLA